MRRQHRIVALAAWSLCSVWLTASAAAAVGAPASVPLPGSAPQPATAEAQAALGEAVEATPAPTPVEFTVGLEPSDPASAAALARAVSDPSSASYRHFLTAAQWEKRFSPSKASVEAVSAWLGSQGIAVGAVSPDRMTIQASATAATIERAFGTGLAQYRLRGRTLRASTGALSVPATIAPLISGVSGVNQRLNKPAALNGSGLGEAEASGAAETGEAEAAPQSAPKISARAKKKAGKEIPQPPGFRNAPPCSSYYGQASDTTDPPYGGGFPSPLPYAPCGYTPPQLQSAYGLSSQIAGGIDGRGVTVAIVDAYASPTLLADAQQYSARNQPGQPLESSQYSQLLPKKFTNLTECEASEWFGEQTLDVEAVHATAPGAHILYVGAKNCEAAMFEAVQQVVDGHLADIITNSWGDDGGDVIDSAGTRKAFDNVLLMAGGTGIGVQFSSGDEGDEFANLGATVADYPSSSPYQTAVGGTSLQVGQAGNRLGELGWSTSLSDLCTTLLLEEELPGCTKGKLGSWVPKAPGEYDYGSGGGTSYFYPEPYYQQGVVPAALANRNKKATKESNRVEPDVSMDADPTTGMLVGETQAFPDGVYYDQYRIGGTSLSSPLFAGVMADADQAAGTPLGFVNPLLYRLAAAPGAYAGTFYDVVPAGLQADVRNDYLDGTDANEGVLTSVRVLDFEGREQFCKRPKKCSSQKVALNVASGFDSMTGIGAPGDGLIAALANP
ncbi:MAG TPA: S53 family peptidase [Solirubrobacteraceae bacterium]|nr:S53 family peptidase [Solirubrobacteraceae bacterium]